MPTTHCLLVARHINCPQHDDPSVDHNIHQIDGFKNLVEFISDGFGEYKVLQVVSVNEAGNKCPNIYVSEQYDRHAVQQITIEFDAVATPYMLGPWKRKYDQIGFVDREGNPISDVLDCHLNSWFDRKEAK